MLEDALKDVAADAADDALGRAWPIWQKPWFKVGLAAGVLGGMLVLAVVVVILQFRLSHLAAARKVREEVARIQAAGEPITTDDFYAFHKVPPGTRDITKDWLGVLAALDENALNASGQALPIFGEVDIKLLNPAADGSKFAEAEALLKNFADPLAQIHAAAELDGQCCFPLEFEKGIGALLPHAQEMRSVQRLLALEARVRFHRGDVPGALQTIRHMLKAGQTLDQATTLIEQFVRSALYSMAFSEIEFLLNHAELTEAQLAELQQQVAALDIKSGLTTGMPGERGMGYVTFQQVRSLADVEALGGAGPPAEWEKQVNVSVGRPADCQKYLELMGEMVAATREPLPAARERVAQVEGKLKQLVGTSNPLDRLKYVVTSLLTPATGKAVDAVARIEARREALVAVIAAERYRLANGAYPTKLNDLVPQYLPAVPSDPFSSQPLRMNGMPGAVAIYSVGPNGQDDQGVETDHRGEPDVVVPVKGNKDAD